MSVFQSGGGDFSRRHISEQSVMCDTSSTKWHGSNPERTQGVLIDMHSYRMGMCTVYLSVGKCTIGEEINPQDAAYRIYPSWDNYHTTPD
mmetsp:Transcript_32599/g.36606  ORF Transcript_32599/g.36606 Transcript_32599/m.36606 type:complete len:90 (-) Transcript_32599:22-291(-)